MTRDEERARVWRSLGATPQETDELLSYAEDGFDRSVTREPQTFPLEDEPFVAAWAEYVADSIGQGAVPALAKRLVQFGFPVAAGISETDSYRAATRRGAVDGQRAMTALALRDPAGIRMFLHQTAAGRIPVIVARHRGDFETLVCALTRRNEPVPVAPSIGACMVAGYNNWDRVARLRHHMNFTELLADKSRYQDRFILLSEGPYSATPAGALGLEPTSWLALSRIIRLEHECTHYFTRRVLGSMNNRLFDELIADYMGIVLATGRFRADWLLRFMGLEGFPAYREEGRLAHYRGTPPLSSGAFRILQRAVVQGASNLERFDAAMDGDVSLTGEGAHRILALAHGTLEDLASGLFHLEAGLCMRTAAV